MKIFVFFLALMFSYLSVMGIISEIVHRTEIRHANDGVKFFYVYYLPTIILWTWFFYLYQI